LGLWSEPATNTPQDAAAATRMNDFHIGWLVLVVVMSKVTEMLSSTVVFKAQLDQ
jgi:beta-glucosidase